MGRRSSPEHQIRSRGDCVEGKARTSRRKSKATGSSIERCVGASTDPIKSLEAEILATQQQQEEVTQRLNQQAGLLRGLSGRFISAIRGAGGEHSVRELRRRLAWLQQKESQLREEKLLLLIESLSVQPNLQAPGADAAVIAAAIVASNPAPPEESLTPEQKAAPAPAASATSAVRASLPRRRLRFGRSVSSASGNLGGARKQQAAEKVFEAAAAADEVLGRREDQEFLSDSNARQAPPQPSWRRSLGRGKPRGRADTVSAHDHANKDDPGFSSDSGGKQAPSWRRSLGRSAAGGGGNEWGASHDGEKLLSGARTPENGSVASETGGRASARSGASETHISCYQKAHMDLVAKGGEAYLPLSKDHERKQFSGSIWRRPTSTPPLKDRPRSVPLADLKAAPLEGSPFARLLPAAAETYDKAEGAGEAAAATQGAAARVVPLRSRTAPLPAANIEGVEHQASERLGNSCDTNTTAEASPNALAVAAASAADAAARAPPPPPSQTPRSAAESNKRREHRTWERMDKNHHAGATAEADSNDDATAAAAAAAAAMSVLSPPRAAHPSAGGGHVPMMDSITRCGCPPLLRRTGSSPQLARISEQSTTEQIFEIYETDTTENADAVAAAAAAAAAARVVPRPWKASHCITASSEDGGYPTAEQLDNSHGNGGTASGGVGAPTPMALPSGKATKAESVCSSVAPPQLSRIRSNPLPNQQKSASLTAAVPEVTRTEVATVEREKLPRVPQRHSLRRRHSIAAGMTIASFRAQPAAGVAPPLHACTGTSNCTGGLKTGEETPREYSAESAAKPDVAGASCAHSAPSGATAATTQRNTPLADPAAGGDTKVVTEAAAAAEDESPRLAPAAEGGGTQLTGEGAGASPADAVVEVQEREATRVDEGLKVKAPPSPRPPLPLPPLLHVELQTRPNASLADFATTTTLAAEKETAFSTPAAATAAVASAASSVPSAKASAVNASSRSTRGQYRRSKQSLHPHNTGKHHPLASVRDLLTSCFSFVDATNGNSSLPELQRKEMRRKAIAAARRAEVAAAVIMESPPLVWVSEYEDMSKMYGLGYLLSDGSSGIAFKDGTKMALNTALDAFEYIERADADDGGGTEEEDFTLRTNGGGWPSPVTVVSAAEKGSGAAAVTGSATAGAKSKLQLSRQTSRHYGRHDSRSGSGGEVQQQRQREKQQERQELARSAHAMDDYPADLEKKLVIARNVRKLLQLASGAGDSAAGSMHSFAPLRPGQASPAATVATAAAAARKFESVGGGREHPRSGGRNDDDDDDDDDDDAAAARLGGGLTAARMIRAAKATATAGAGPLTFVEDWKRTRSSWVFRLSNHTLQMIFVDATEIMLREDGRLITYVDKSGNRETLALLRALEQERLDVIVRVRECLSLIKKIIAYDDRHA